MLLSACECAAEDKVAMHFHAARLVLTTYQQSRGGNGIDPKRASA
jgi:hypothetical protein